MEENTMEHKDNQRNTWKKIENATIMLKTKDYEEV